MSNSNNYQGPPMPKWTMAVIVVVFLTFLGLLAATSCMPPICGPEEHEGQEQGQ